MRATLALPAIALLAAAVSGCERPLPPEERGEIVVPPGPQAGGAGAPLVAPTRPYATSQATQQRQEQSGYYPTAGAPLVPPESTNFTAPAHYVDRASMREVLLASNPAVYSNPVFTSRPNLYEDPASYQAWLASQTMSGGTVPPPAPRPLAVDRTVFFNWNEATLTPEGSAIVDGLANQARGDAAAEIALIGKADLSGADAYNMTLSQRRAAAVRDRLVADGVAATRIETRWVGEHEPPVPTANGVREARNRVVDVTMTTMVGSSAPPPQPVVLERRVLFTTTENSPPGSVGEEMPGSIATGSMSGQAGQ